MNKSMELVMVNLAIIMASLTILMVSLTIIMVITSKLVNLNVDELIIKRFFMNSC